MSRDWWKEAGFDGFSMSEHPYPDKGWLANGGHHAFDPFVSLSFAAAATTRYPGDDLHPGVGGTAVRT